MIYEAVRPRSGAPRSVGVPLLLDQDLGWVPVDDELPILADGGSVARVDWDRGAADGSVERGERLIRVFGADPRPGLVQTARRPAGYSFSPMTAAARERLLAIGARAERTQSSLRLAVVVEDAVDVRRIPPRKWTAGALAEGGQPDHLRSLRLERTAARRDACTATVERITAWLAQAGGEVLSVATLPVVTVQCELAPGKLPDLLDLQDVRAVFLAARKGKPDGSRSIEYGCTETDRFDATVDGSSDCESTEADKFPATYMDLLHLATGLSQYHDEAYTGAGTEGIATWAAADELSYRIPGTRSRASGVVPHIGIAVVEGPDVSPRHAAFQDREGRNRVYAFIGTRSLRFDIDNAPDTSSDYNHGTSAAGIAMGSILDGQDQRVSDTDQRKARSGVAQMARGIFGETQIGGYFDTLSGFELPADVLSNSSNSNAGADPDVDEDLDAACDAIGGSICDLANLGDPSFEDPCPTLDQARGLDDLSQRVNDAWFDGIITVKSAGNMHQAKAINSVAWCALFDPSGSAASEVSAPGAAATVLSVGAVSNFRKTVEEIQTSEALHAVSSQTATLDGRTYPLIASPAMQCGCANRPATAPPGIAHPAHQDYVKLGATSGAAPRVAGAVAVFKHWYLYNHGAAIGNEPGRILVNMLNMGDGYQHGTGESPLNGWGLGRLRMRLFDPATMSGDWYRVSASMPLRTGDAEVLEIVPDDESIRSSLRRVRVTLWWPEMNTGEGEEKPRLFALVFDGTLGVIRDYAYSDQGSPIRFGWDCEGGSAPFPVALTLMVWMFECPTEERGYLRDYRTVYVSAMYETGADTTRRVCDDDAYDADSCRA